MNQQRLLNVILTFGLVDSLLLPLGSTPASAQLQPDISIHQSSGGTIIPEVIFDVNGLTQHVAWQDSIAYLGVGNNLVSLDVSDPTTPARLG